MAPALVALYGAIWIAVGPKAPAIWGDASTYLDLALRLPNVLVAGDAGYFTLRLLPSALVHVALWLLGLPLDRRHAFLAFEILDVGLLVVGAWAWGRIGRVLAWDTVRQWLGFVLLFLSFAVSGFGLIVPPLTDTAAVVIGILQVWFFLSGRGVSLLLVTLAAAFTWPQAFAAGLVLFLLPRGKADDRPAPAPAVAVGIVLAVGHATWLWALWRRGETQLPFAGQQIHWGLVAFSIAGCALYLLWLAKGLVGFNLTPRGLATPDLARRVTAAAAAVAFVVVAASVLGYGAPSRYRTLLVTPVGFLSWSVLASVILPFLPFLAHALYFGPVVFLLGVRAEATLRVVRAWGPGASLYALGYGLLLLNPSSRVSVSFLPFLVAAVCTVIATESWGRRRVAAITAFAVVMGRAWLPAWTLIGDASVFEGQAPAAVRWMRGVLPLHNLDGGTHRRFLAFPHQWFFMVQGPWMSVEMYIVQGTVAIILGALAFLVVRQRAAL